MDNKVTGYKVTNSDGCCRGYAYEVGQEYKHEGRIELCDAGFHFCMKPVHCFNYYEFDPANRVFEIEASGNVKHGDNKSVTDTIRFVREIPWSEVLVIVNQGVGNTGHSNAGDKNTGNNNTGNNNTGYNNTGDKNTGNNNTGNNNTGYNNTGYGNAGDRNTGNNNTGYKNTGDWNTGNNNTGYGNAGDRNTGLFCTGEASFPIFNKPSGWTERDFMSSGAYNLLCWVDTKQWIPSSHMTEDEKKAHPSHTTTEGYLKDIPFKEAFGNAWHNWNETNRNKFRSLPNFDAAIFEEITGVKA